MGLFNRKHKYEERAEGEIRIDDALLRAMLGESTATKEMALQIPTVSGGIDLIANIIAGTPIKLYRESDGKTEEVRDDQRVFLLNDETGDTLNASEFWHALVRDYYVGRGGYAYINRSKGKVKSLHYVDEAQISIDTNNDPIFKDFNIRVMGESYKPYDFLKILRNTRNGAEGVPITVENSRLIITSYQQMILEYTMARRGGKKKGYLQTDGVVDRDTLDTLKSSWATIYSSDSENIMVLNKGLKFQEASDTAAEMQMAESKLGNAREFAELFHVSVDAIGGKEQDVRALAKLAAIPLMSVIQCALNKDLLLEREKGSMYFAFDTKELLKGEMTERFSAYKTALDANFMQIDEVRFMEDLEPLGLNWIKLGLQDVLYDPATGTVYTPNTNQTGGLGKTAIGKAAENVMLMENGTQEDEEPAEDDEDPEDIPEEDLQDRAAGDNIELRDVIKDEHGKFAGSTDGNHGGNRDGNSAGNHGGKGEGKSGNSKKSKVVDDNSVYSEEISSKNAEKITSAINANPGKLKNTTPGALKSQFEKAGFETTALSRGRKKDVSFDKGGGWKVNLDSEHLIMYHPADASHHDGAYYKISSGKEGVKRYGTDGTIIT